MNQSDLFFRLSGEWQGHQPRRFSRAGLREAAVLVAVTDHPYQPSLLLTRRAADMPTHQGEVAFPGGKRDDTDHDLVATALREAHEEVGLSPEYVQVVGMLDQVVSKFGFLVTPVLAVIPHDVALTADPRELDCLFHVPLAFFDQPPSGYFQRDGIRMPTWIFERFRIWGLTAYITAEMLNRYFAAEIALGTVVPATAEDPEDV
jgi:8-oxo-dGTP pyrophosphatase MutT (NUDIX family)